MRPGMRRSATMLAPRFVLVSRPRGKTVEPPVALRRLCEVVGPSIAHCPDPDSVGPCYARDGSGKPCAPGPAQLRWFPVSRSIRGRSLPILAHEKQSVDCNAGRALGCQTFCCRLLVRLTDDERRYGDGRLSPKNCLDKRPDGWCVHLEQHSERCSVWDDRPETCRAYDCTNDPRLQIVLRDGFHSLTALAFAPPPVHPPVPVPRRPVPHEVPVITTTKHRSGVLASDPEMWEALRHGDKLNVILEDFYTRVYADERLAHFFHGTTKQRAIEKQYSFLAEIFSGIKQYFGDRPRNAHSWMVISNELFDYRERLMEECLRRAELPEHLIKRWMSIEEVFRKQIVKSRPRGKKIDGVELPHDGYDDIVIAVGSMCDHCQNAMEAGDKARYHLRTGHTYCANCWSAVGADGPKRRSSRRSIPCPS